MTSLYWDGRGKLVTTQETYASCHSLDGGWGGEKIDVESGLAWVGTRNLLTSGRAGPVHTFALKCCALKVFEEIAV